MSESRLQEGDRVVHIGWNDWYEGVGGTIVAMERLPDRSGVFGSPEWYLRVILDTAETIEDRAVNFVPESDFHSGDYIPF